MEEYPFRNAPRTGTERRRHVPHILPFFDARKALKSAYSEQGRDRMTGKRRPTQAQVLLADKRAKGADSLPIPPANEVRVVTV